MPTLIVEISMSELSEIMDEDLTIKKFPNKKGKSKRICKTSNARQNAKSKKSSAADTQAKKLIMPRNNVDVTSKPLLKKCEGENGVALTNRVLSHVKIEENENMLLGTNNQESNVKKNKSISAHKEAEQFFKNCTNNKPRQRKSSVEVEIIVGNDIDDDCGVVGFLKMSPLQIDKTKIANISNKEGLPIPIKLEKTKSHSKISTAAKAKRPIKSATTTTNGKSNQKKPVQNQQITDFYPVRRSNRKTKTQVKKQIEDDMIDAVMNNCEDGLKIFDFKDKGRGIVATKEFKANSFVVEYAGDLISWKVAKQRELEYAVDSSIGCYMYYFNADDVNYCIDATAESGKKGRLLNHSRKNPNCKTKLIKVPTEDGKFMPRLVLIAARDIQVGEELTYDYGDRDKQSLETHPWLKT